jgi:hypothetical protein
MPTRQLTALNLHAHPATVYIRGRARPFTDIVTEQIPHRKIAKHDKTAI